jgi:hypothetical protein
MLNVLTLCGLLPEFLNPQNDQVARACVLDEGIGTVIAYQFTRRVKTTFVEW